MYLLFFIVLGVGILTGYTYANAKLRKNVSGSLRLDTSESESEPFLFLELKEDISVVRERQFVVLSVNIKNYNTQK